MIAASRVTVRQLRVVETTPSRESNHALVSFERATPWGGRRVISAPATTNSSGGERLGSSRAKAAGLGAAGEERVARDQRDESGGHRPARSSRLASFHSASISSRLARSGARPSAASRVSI